MKRVDVALQTLLRPKDTQGFTKLTAYTPTFATNAALQLPQPIRKIYSSGPWVAVHLGLAIANPVP